MAAAACASGARSCLLTAQTSIRHQLRTCSISRSNSAGDMHTPAPVGMPDARATDAFRRLPAQPREQERATPAVFLSWQLSLASAAGLCHWSGSAPHGPPAPAPLLISWPRFNQAPPHSADARAWDELLRGRAHVLMDVPVYTERVKDAFADMVSAQAFAPALLWARAPSVRRAVDVGLHPHLHPAQKNALGDALELLCAPEEEPVRRRLVAFRDWFLALRPDSIPSKSAWATAVRAHLAPGADFSDPDALHVLRVLTLFGASPARALFVAETCAQREGREVGQTRLRFLSKALCGYGVAGCITDAVHVVLALCGLPLADGTLFQPTCAEDGDHVYRGPGDEALVQLLRAFSDASQWTRVQAERVAWLCGDHEPDDRVAAAVVAAVRRHFGLSLPRGLVQLDSRALAAVRLPAGGVFEAVLDEASRNTAKVLEAEPPALDHRESDVVALWAGVNEGRQTSAPSWPPLQRSCSAAARLEQPRHAAAVVERFCRM